MPSAVRLGDGSVHMLSCARGGGSAVAWCVPTLPCWQLARAGLIKQDKEGLKHLAR